MTICFHAQTDPANFAPCGVRMDGVRWPTVERSFQARKSGDAADPRKIRPARKPKDAKALGMTRHLSPRPDRQGIKIDVMRAALPSKCRSHPAPRAMLFLTGQDLLAQNAAMDAFRGCGPDGPDGPGLNWRGRLRMETRQTLRSARS